MADVTITPTEIDINLRSHRQVILSTILTATYSTQNTNNNDIRVDGRGKGRMTVAVNNAPNQALTAQLYGMHSKTSNVGDAGVFPIGASFTAALADKYYQTYNDPFPFYLLRLTHAVAPTDAPAKAVTAWMNFSSA